MDMSMGYIVVCVQCSARPYSNAIKHRRLFFTIPPSLNLNMYMYLRSGFPIPLQINRVLDIARLVPWPAHKPLHEPGQLMCKLIFPPHPVKPRSHNFCIAFMVHVITLSGVFCDFAIHLHNFTTVPALRFIKA